MTIATYKCLTRFLNNGKTRSCYGFTEIEDVPNGHSLIVRNDIKVTYFPILLSSESLPSDRCLTGICTYYGKVCSPKLEITVERKSIVEKNISFNYDFDAPVTVVLSPSTDGSNSKTGSGVNNIDIYINTVIRYVRITDYYGREIFYYNSDSAFSEKTFSVDMVYDVYRFYNN